MDVARGIALGLMLLYNWTYALWYLDIFTITNRGNWLYWTAFARFIAALFIFIVGVSLTLSVNRMRQQFPEQWQAIANRKYPARGLRIFALGLGITVVTYWYAPERFIYFGILHLIGVAILVSRPLLTRRRAALLTGLVAIIAGPLVSSVETQSRILASFGLTMNQPTFDYFPIFPWIGVAFLGIWMGHAIFPEGSRRFELGHMPEIPLLWDALQTFQFVGRHTLIIYLTHQPALLVILGLLGYDFI